MSSKNLFLMTGPPGCGKSSYIQANMREDCVHVSRDKIRFSIVPESEAYFSQEDKVFDEFIKQIQEGLDNHMNVFADATHLNEKSRNKILDKLNLEGVKIIPISFELPLDICITQNNYRTGRERVPESVIQRMYYSFTNPEEDKKYKYAKVVHIK